MKALYSLWIILFSSSFLFGQLPSHCHPEKSHEFDFWIGTWEVSSGNQVSGTNRIQPILGGCILQENWTGINGTEGTSFNFYNSAKNRWEQFWVWKNGIPMHLTGNLTDGKMVLSGDVENRKGTIERHRITWTPNPDGTVRQFWEKTPLSEENWTVLFDAIYKRKEP